MVRKLIFSRTMNFTGWYCQGCSWALSFPRFKKLPKADAKLAFEAHRCHPFRTVQPERFSATPSIAGFSRAA